MSRFHLLSDGQRSILVGEEDLPLFGPEWTGRGRVEAADWLYAKSALGFELTPHQEALLPLSLPERMRYVQLKMLRDSHWAGRRLP